MGRETAQKNRSVLRSKANGRVKKSDLMRDLGPGTVIQNLLKLRCSYSTLCRRTVKSFTCPAPSFACYALFAALMCLLAFSLILELMGK